MKRKIVTVIAVGLCVWACSSRKNKLEREVLAETEQGETLVRKYVHDEDRRDKMLALQARRMRTTRSFFESLKETRRAWVRINSDYASRPDTFGALRRQSSGIRRRHAENLIATAIEARSFATREEWEAMAKEYKE